ncbi:MAG: prepilin-type N-terminal cleavage/methylation domain-containing protein [Thermodesulfobacteriota bacterium]|jgi:prepilin-type N-terminal cleavage/methylation domain-containing protein
MKNLQRAEGFTMVEIILALFIGGVLMSAVYAVMISGQRSSAGVERKVAAQQDVRAALEIMAMEIGMASYNPFLATGIWLQGPSVPPDGSKDCIIAGNQTYKGIQEAKPTSITVEMDIGSNGFGNGSIAGADQNEVIRYDYDAAKQYITRSTNCGTAQPFLGADATTAPAGTRTVKAINSTAGINNGAGVAAIFRYYDSSGTELNPGTTPADMPKIRRVDITLAVETEERDPSTNQYRQMIYSTSVLVRNHAIN